MSKWNGFSLFPWQLGTRNRDEQDEDKILKKVMEKKFGFLGVF